MKTAIFTVIFSVIFLLTSYSQPFRLEGDFGGGWSNYNLNTSGLIKSVRIQALATNTNAGFIFNNDQLNYTPKWCGSNAPNVFRPLDSLLTGQAYYYNGGGWDQNLEISITNGNYYTFIIDGTNPSSTSNRDISILETDYLPVTIDSVYQTQNDTVEPTDSVTVFVKLSATLNASEKVFLRWSNDGWSSSNFIEISNFDGSNLGSGIIHSQANGTTVSYYVLTTERTNPVGSTIDYYTLNLKNNNNLNYQYDVVMSKFINISFDGLITEGAENNELIDVTLFGDTFVNMLNTSNWTFSNLPSGVTVGNINRVNDTLVQLTLSGNSTVDYDSDITNFSVEISNIEIQNLTAGSLIDSSGVTFTAIIESDGIFLHMLSYQNFTHTLGDNASDWLNAELGQTTWNQSDIGYGTNNSDTTGFSWSTADWYEDGSGNNRRIHSLISIPSSLGTGDFYYVARARDLITDEWHYANDTVWANNLVFNPQYKITINAVPQIDTVSAIAIDSSNIDLTWQHDLTYQTVMIVAKIGSAISSAPAQGTTYNVSDIFDGGTVIYKGTNQNFTHSGLNASTTVYYSFFTVNNDYYSAVKDTFATSTDGTEPKITISDDGQISEGSENGEIIYITLENDTFVNVLNSSNWTVSNLPTGVSVGSISRTDDYHAQILLSGNTSIDYDVDITNISVSITSDEFVTMSSGTLTADTGVTFTAIIEADGIWLHMLSYENIVHTLGDNASDWLNAELGQTTWNQSDIGYGTNNSDTTGFSWSTADWYEDGSGNNRRIHSLISIPSSLGTGDFYYVARARDLITDEWHYANDTVWANTPVFNPKYKITINEVPKPTVFDTISVSSNTVNLSWTLDSNYQNVMLVASTGSDISTTAVQGTHYNVNDSISNGVVIYSGTAQQFSNTGLQPATNYFYNLYTVNNDYYSLLDASVKLTATTLQQTVCNMNISLGNDTNICGGGSVLLSTGLTVSPFGDSLKITYDATSGTTGLAGATKVYMHAGAELHQNGAWQYTIGNWGLDDGIGLMTNVGGNIWEKTINPINYFGYSADSSLWGILIVFRNADGTLTGKNDANGDIWIDMSANPPVSAFSGVSTYFSPNLYNSITWSNGATSQNLAVSVSGDYSITVTDINGCSDSDTISVGLHGLPIVNIGNSVLLCGQDSVIFDASSSFFSYLWSDSTTSQTLIARDSGLYSVTVTDIYGCHGFDYVTVNQSEIPSASFLVDTSNGLNVTFIDSSHFATNYEWDFNGDGTIDNTSSGDVTYLYQSAGQYNVILKVLNDCGDSTINQLIVVNNVSVNKLDNDNDLISIYPNPVNDYLTIECDKCELIKNIELTDIVGNNVNVSITQKDNRRFTIDTKTLTNGYYFISINNRKENSKSFIKIK